MNILILGATGEIGRMATQVLLEQTDANLVLYARNALKRIKVPDAKRVRLIEGDFNDYKKLVEAMQGIEIVYINAMGSISAMKIIAEAMSSLGIKRMVGATILSIYDEVPGAFGDWNKRMVGIGSIRQVAEATSVFEKELFDYTLLRITWLYNQPGNTKYMLTAKGQPFEGAQVTRQAVAQLIVDIVNAKDDRFIQKSLGVCEPGTNWGKPSFY
jgi:hypothetical protein